MVEAITTPLLRGQHLWALPSSRKHGFLHGPTLTPMRPTGPWKTVMEGRQRKEMSRLSSSKMMGVHDDRLPDQGERLHPPPHVPMTVCQIKARGASRQPPSTPPGEGRQIQPPQSPCPTPSTAGHINRI
jgi:hypothetical protein